MKPIARLRHPDRWLLVAALLLTFAVYAPGLSGGWLFDDYPNIVQNTGVQPAHAALADLVRAAMSSPSSEFKRPLASLSFALNYLGSGLDPFWWKVTNLILHLLNGLLVFVLAKMLLALTLARTSDLPPAQQGTDARRAGIVAAWVAAAWMLLPINLTGVLYVVQRMESMANLFVLLGLIGYVVGRRQMCCAKDEASLGSANPPPRRTARLSEKTRGLLLCAASLILATSMGLLAKETAVMLPFYAFLIEAIVFRFRRKNAASASTQADTPTHDKRRDRAIVALFTLILFLPLAAGLVWQLPHVLRPETWANRDFTLTTRLLSEARIVSDYVAWTVLPLPHWLSFYHDDFPISTGLLTPWTTLASMLFLLALAVLAWRLRTRQPLTSLGIALYLGCHVLTGTILPLELIYEHRNYFASFGLMLAIVPLLAVPATAAYPLARRVLLGALLLLWSGATLATAVAWGSSLRLAQELAFRAPESSRAQYSLGRTYIIYSKYDPSSPFTPLVYAPMERAAKLPHASILPLQALIFFNARMHRPIKEVWWDDMIAKLAAHKPGVEDQSSLAALTVCARDGECDLPKNKMQEAFKAALSHPDPAARLLANYSDYAWNLLDDHELGLRMAEKASSASPNEPAYHITLARMFIVEGQLDRFHQQIRELERLNFGGRLDGSIAGLRKLDPSASSPP